MSFFSKTSASQVPEITALEVHNLLQAEKTPFLLDVREPEEYRLGHIPGANLVPLDDLTFRLDEIPSDRVVVCVCATGQRSLLAARLLAARGYTASSLSGGMLAWQMAGLPTQSGL
jgi:rhodanese-related sulfurtransferase